MIDGRYDTLEKLGAGSMGVVYLAQDVFLDRQVAIKVIDPGYARDPVTIERFKKEAQALAKIRHQNVVQVYAFGPHEASYYFAMEYVPGRSLEAAVDSGETVDVGYSLGILRAIASGLGAVHALKLVHRDVKPANIVIERDTARPVLIDFGLARRRSASTPRMSITAGTPMYMAPEQAADPNGTNVTFAADIYALACTAYELFTGRPVFDGKDVYDILRAHLKLPAPPLSTHRPDLAVFDPTFLRALAKNPTERHASATDFVEELTEALRRKERQTKRDTLAPPSSVRGTGGPKERVLLLARDDGVVKQLNKATSRVVASLGRDAVIEHVASATELIASFNFERAALVLIDDESSEILTTDLARQLRESYGGATVGILVVSREWQKLRPVLAGISVREVIPKPLVVQMLTSALERIAARRWPAASSGT